MAKPKTSTSRNSGNSNSIEDPCPRARRKITSHSQHKLTNENSSSNPTSSTLSTRGKNGDNAPQSSPDLEKVIQNMLKETSPTTPPTSSKTCTSNPKRKKPAIDKDLDHEKSSKRQRKKKEVAATTDISKGGEATTDIPKDGEATKDIPKGGEATSKRSPNNEVAESKNTFKNELVRRYLDSVADTAFDNLEGGSNAETNTDTDANVDADADADVNANGGVDDISEDLSITNAPVSDPIDKLVLESIMEIYRKHSDIRYTQFQAIRCREQRLLVEADMKKLEMELKYGIKSLSDIRVAHS